MMRRFTDAGAGASAAHRWWRLWGRCTLKLLSGAGESLCGRLLTFEAGRSEFREWRLPRRDDCPSCGHHPVGSERKA